MQRVVANQRLGGSGNRAVTRPAHPSSASLGNHLVHRLIQDGSQAGDSGEFAASYPPVSELVNDAVGGPGAGLDGEMRNFMESRFGYDFSQVKLHTDSKAADSAAAINAKAYTVGNEIVFGDGQFSPGTDEGKRLLAHELTHVVQQGSGPVAGAPTVDDSLSISDPEDTFEKAADACAEQVIGNATGEAMQSVGEGTATVNREGADQDDDETLGAIGEAGKSALELGEEAGVPEGAGGIFGGAMDIASGINQGGAKGVFDVTKGALDVGGGIGEAAIAGGAAESGIAGTLADLGPVAGILGGAKAIDKGINEGGGMGALDVAKGGLGLTGGIGEAALAAGAEEAGVAGVLADAGPLAPALGAGMLAGTGLATVADSSLTRTGAFGTDANTGQNQSAMDWGANWGTDWDKVHNNGGPSVIGGILAGAGGIVGGLGGAAYGAGKWLGDNL
jgi:Domain of unknown function (DUF4157)